MNRDLADAQARQRALAADRSFIIQAPAGSGKTELLIQRYLTLLQHVEQPEQIVAITFTRKAAAEMRVRVMQALAAAAAKDPVSKPHEALTLSLAESALARDASLGWSLLIQPQRMRIDTLDALNAWLARQLPILSGGIAGASIVEDCGQQYRLAARRTLDELAGSNAVGLALRSLLRVLDNSIERLESLLAGLLARRDQWLRHLVSPSGTVLRRQLERSLDNLVREELVALRALWSKRQLEDLVPLMRHAARYAERDQTRRETERWLELESLPTDPIDALSAFRGVGHLLLTRDGAWRRRITKSEGFRSDHTGPKRRLMTLLDSLRDDESLREALAAATRLPDPHYSDLQWQDLWALRQVLIHLVAELRVIFSEQQVVDFVELGLSAHQALGLVDEPSELLLALDQRIQHILIDEFQDTSQSQLGLVELLTAGWQPGDGRSLFLVGDPMQSIYRFRDADMSLFLQVKERGVGNVNCEVLILESNFRSAPKIVDWVNHAFSHVFPDSDQIAKGAAQFYPCIATRDSAEHHAVNLHLLRTANDEAELEHVIGILELERARAPEQSVAILVQSRSHLVGLHDRLRGKGWPVHAVEIDTITEQQLGQDLIGLTRALSHLGDRIAWLGVLRAPWCGLRWVDLHALCGVAPMRTIWDLMHDADRVKALSEEGRRRLLATRSVLDTAFRLSGMESFARWVERTWRMLDGPACLDRDEDLATVHRFFNLLDGISRRGDLDDPAVIEDAFSRPQRQADPPREAGIEIMTIHRAKGLEFDTVILFGLARTLRGDDTKTFHWMERVGIDGASHLVMAPLSSEEDRLSKFVKHVEQQRELTEQARVLYVATTRARDRLHLVCQLKPGRDTPAKGTLLARLWPYLAKDFADAEIELPDRATTTEDRPPQLRRLADGFDGTDDGVVAEGGDYSQERLQPEFEWAGHTAVQVGTIVHRHLQQMANTCVDSWDVDTVNALTGRFRRELTLLGVDPDELDFAVTRVADALAKVLQDPRGRWLLSAHLEARSELRLTFRGAHGLEHVQLDRTFVDDGTRWVIDYKTSVHEGGDLVAFLDAEADRYRAQLERYAQTMAQIDDRPIRCGLYFPLLSAFRDWEPDL